MEVIKSAAAPRIHVFIKMTHGSLCRLMGLVHKLRSSKDANPFEEPTTGNDNISASSENIIKAMNFLIVLLYFF